jgi:hypothetical protein
MKHYIKSYLFRNNITYDMQNQDGIQTLIVRPKHKENVISAIKKKDVKKVEEKLDLIFITLK